MRATITAKGILVISAETELESFALNAWSEKNVRESEGYNILLETPTTIEDKDF